MSIGAIIPRGVGAFVGLTASAVSAGTLPPSDAPRAKPDLCPPAIVAYAEPAPRQPSEARVLFGSRPPQTRPRPRPEPPNLFGDLREHGTALEGSRVASLLGGTDDATDANDDTDANESMVPSLIPVRPAFRDARRRDRSGRLLDRPSRPAPRPVMASPPQRRETANGMGWETLNWDPITEAFARLPLEMSPALLLDVGCGYGRIARAAAANGAAVMCNDLDSRHLYALAQEIEPANRGRFLLHEGNFLYEFPYRHQAFDAILVSRMAHFLNPEQVMKLLRKCWRLLRPGGRLFITTGTPYLSSFREFTPRYEERKRAGKPWPGYIDGVTEKVTDYFPGARGHLPDSMNLFDPDILNRALTESRFQLQVPADYIEHPDSPTGLALDGRELVGAVGVK